MSDISVRRMDLRIEVDLWRWPEGQLRDTLDITRDARNYRFQKSIKNPQGSCQLAMIPQSSTLNILDVLNPMDVIRIYEFGTLKFIGYLTRISYQGSINSTTGKPQRDAVISARQFGGLLVTANIGLGLGTALGEEGDPLLDGAAQLNRQILNATQDGVTFSEMVTILYNSFRDYLTAIDATNFIRYLDTYLNVSSGLTGQDAPALPRTFELFTGTETSLTFWQVAEQLVQRPFNEFWIDNGPRQVSIAGDTVTLPEQASVVFRPTPFNGTVSGGSIGNAFDSLETLTIPKDYLLMFNLNRSMDEVYTFYSVKEPAFQLSDTGRLLLGRARVDTDRVGKYLLRPLITELFYIRVEDLAADEREATESQAIRIADEGAETLLNWFSLNDEFLSGVVTIMVPDESRGDRDPRIGEKVALEGLSGFFYVEGIAHKWEYQKPLMCDLTLTRGYNRTGRIELTDRLFTRNRIR